MPLDYAVIRKENRIRYGTDIGRYGQMLFADRYAERSHFIYELLQNAEDALRKQPDASKSRSVDFRLLADALTFSHFGRTFTQDDVQGICGICQSTKSNEPMAMGRFGIGFKSVYAFTDSPEIHSGEDHFTIESFVFPKEIRPVATQPGETLIRLPLPTDSEDDQAEISRGLQELGLRTLLFLREIEKVSWTVEGHSSGEYKRLTEDLGSGVRRVTLIDQRSGAVQPTEETWLIFERKLATTEDTTSRVIEVAFQLTKASEGEPWKIQPVRNSTLVVYFPTVVSTNLNFLIQGPYHTTPSRDNVPWGDDWNRRLISETSELLVEAIEKLKERGMLCAETLETLPIDSEKFPKGSPFAPLFNAVKSAFRDKELLPRFGGGYVSASRAKIAQPRELRDLFQPDQLRDLFASKYDISWIGDNVGFNLSWYLEFDLEVQKIDLECLGSLLKQRFLKVQVDDRMVRLYRFLGNYPEKYRFWENRPIVRLENGDHVAPECNGQPQAFLPSSARTRLPRVRKSLCHDPAALRFLKGVGLTEVDLADDILKNVLPKYQPDTVEVSDADYGADIERILVAFSTDSRKQRDRLIKALRTARFVAVRDAGSGSRSFVQPAEAYQATDSFKRLFQGVQEVLIVDDSLACLRGKEIGKLLKESGVEEHLCSIPADTTLTWAERAKMRREAGTSSFSSEGQVDDRTLRGLERLLGLLPTLAFEEASIRAKLLWDSLCRMVDRKGSSLLRGTYSWFYYTWRSHGFDAKFVKLLQTTPWIPGTEATLRVPGCVVFENINPIWDDHPLLRPRLHFKPAINETYAKACGFDPKFLRYLREQGITNQEELKKRYYLRESDVNGMPRNIVGPTPLTRQPRSANGEKPFAQGAEISVTEAGSTASYRDEHESSRPTMARTDQTQERSQESESHAEELHDPDTVTADFIEVSADTRQRQYRPRTQQTQENRRQSVSGLPISMNGKADLEQRGRDFAAKKLESMGYKVTRMSQGNPGFDLRAEKVGEAVKVEVKAHRGKQSSVFITKREWKEYLRTRGVNGETWELWNVENLSTTSGQKPTIRLPKSARKESGYWIDLDQCFREQPESEISEAQ